MIHIVVTTYVPADKPERGKYLAKAITDLGFWLTSPEEPLEFLVVDDGSPELGHMYALDRIVWQKPLSLVFASHGGIGHSLNEAMKQLDKDDLWLYMTDDWLRTGPLVLTKAISLIRQEGYDYVRLGPLHPNLHSTVRFNQRTGWWLEIHPDFEGYAFGTRPFLATRKFYDWMGPFKEQCDAYVCERDYSDRVAVEFNALHGMKMGAVVDDGLEGQWTHIGMVEVGDTYVS